MQNMMSEGDAGRDMDLKRRIASFLRGVGQASLLNLQVDVQRGVVIIAGRVATYYEKQLATCCCQRVAGVRAVINEVQVQGDDADNRTPHPVTKLDWLIG